MKKTDKPSLFLGLDLSTQGLKATAVDPETKVAFEESVNFDSDLSEFGTKGGAHYSPDGLRVTAPPLMWVAALDLLLSKMKRLHNFPFETVSAVSGSGQQHGSVYLRHNTERLLKTLNHKHSLKEQLSGTFSLDFSPIWMDSSTSLECEERDAAMGGAQAVADLTGSRSYERFTGNQIAKIRKEQPEAYENTERIALVSSFMASLLIGGYAPIEPGDGAGMNLMNIRTKRWDRKSLDLTAPGLAERLGEIVPSHSSISRLSDYFAARYGFAEDCKVIAFSGDNPNSLAALRLENSGDVAISLGTSDTLFGALSEPKPSATEGHIFGNPINPDGYMALLCLRNGSLTREAVRDEFAGGSWETFERALERTEPGNGGRVGFYFKEPEITPPVLSPGVYRFGPDCAPAEFTPDENIRALVESQSMLLRLHGSRIGLVPKAVLATGGASVNKSLLRVIADVFGAPVHRGSQPNSASLGAALRALHGWQCEQAGHFLSFDEAVPKPQLFEETTEPDLSFHALYSELLDRYADLEKRI